MVLPPPPTVRLSQAIDEGRATKIKLKAEMDKSHSLEQFCRQCNDKCTTMENDIEEMKRAHAQLNLASLAKQKELTDRLNQFELDCRKQIEDECGVVRQLHNETVHEAPMFRKDPSWRGEMSSRPVGTQITPSRTFVYV